MPNENTNYLGTQSEWGNTVKLSNFVVGFHKLSPESSQQLKEGVERGDFEEIMYLVFKAIERKAVLVLNKIKVQVLETEILNSNLN